MTDIDGNGGEDREARKVRLAYEAAALSEARADVARGDVVLDADLDAFLDGLVDDEGPAGAPGLSGAARRTG